jgi:hypothetical protein
MNLPARHPAAVPYLEQLQRDAALNFAPDWGGALSDEELLEAIEQAIRRGDYPPGTDPEVALDRMRRNQVPASERWSALEPPAHRFFLDRAEQAVVRGLEARGAPVPSAAPAFGTLPTHDINARVLPVPGSDTFVVVYDSGLLELTSAWTAILGSCLRTDRSQALAIAFIDLVFCQVVLGTSAFLYNRIDWGVNRDNTARADAVLRPVMEAFLLAHEYGHVILGHPPNALDFPLEVRHARELEADAYGFGIMLAAFDSPVAVYVAVSSMLGAYALLDRGYNLVEHDSSPSRPTATHPSAIDRRMALAKVAHGALSAADMTEAARWADHVDGETLRLWLPLEQGLWRVRDALPEESLPGWPPNPLEKREALERFVGVIAGSN